MNAAVASLSYVTGSLEGRVRPKASAKQVVILLYARRDEIIAENREIFGPNLRECGASSAAKLATARGR